MAYYAIDPWDEARADLSRAYIASLLSADKDSVLADFMPYQKKTAPHIGDLMKYGDQL